MHLASAGLMWGMVVSNFDFFLVWHINDALDLSRGPLSSFLR
jgi:hypothetical protein